MRRPTRGVIDQLEGVYIESLLIGSEPFAKKNALQRLCKHFRSGLRLRDPRHMNLLVRSHLYDTDPKVVRWSLNALAFLGTEPDIIAIVETIDRNRLDPDILASGVAALAAQVSEERLREQLHARDLPLRGATLLAAAQKVPQLKANLSQERIDIDVASTSELRLAAVLVGIDKAPENMFSIDHANSTVIGELNNHPDQVVAQYSIWALTENDRLGLPQLQISLGDVVSQRENIRGYIYQLVAENPGAARKNFDFLDSASEDRSVAARQHLARGLRNTYFDGLEELTVSWILEEPDPTVRWHLLEHMTLQAVHMRSYRDFVVQAYRSAGEGSAERFRLEAAAHGTDLSIALRRIRYAAEALDLFGPGGCVTNNNTFNAPISAGAFSGSGNATASDVTFNQQREAGEKTSAILQRLQTLLDQSHAPDSSAVKPDVADAARAPTKFKVQTILDWIKVGAEGGKLASSVAAAAPGIADELHHLLPFLPAG